MGFKATLPSAPQQLQPWGTDFIVKVQYDWDEANLHTTKEYAVNHQTYASWNDFLAFVESEITSLNNAAAVWQMANTQVGQVIANS